MYIYIKKSFLGNGGWSCWMDNQGEQTLFLLGSGGGGVLRGESTSACRSRNEVWRFCSSAVRLQKRSLLPHLHLNGFHGWQPKGIVQPKLKFHPFTRPALCPCRLWWHHQFGVSETEATPIKRWWNGNLWQQHAPLCNHIIWTKCVENEC